MKIHAYQTCDKDKTWVAELQGWDGGTPGQRGLTKKDAIENLTDHLQEIYEALGDFLVGYLGK